MDCQTTLVRSISAACLGFILVTGTVIAGAPAPVPDSTGVHQPAHQIANLGAFKFQNGEVVEDFKVSYVTHGRLNEARDNVILSLHAFTGDHHNNDFLIGRGKPLDPGKYFIVATDFIANAHLRHDVTTGPTSSGLNLEFPPITMVDLITADYRLLTEYLGVSQIQAVIGASIGAMEAYQLAVSYPEFVKGIIPIAGSPKPNGQMRSVLRSAMNIITLDPGWVGGNYHINPTAGVTAALMSMSPWWTTKQWYLRKVNSHASHKAWEKALRDYWIFQRPQDGRDLYYQLQLWADYDVGATPGFDGDTRAALESITAKTLLIAFRDDLMVRREEMILAGDSIPNATYLEIESTLGHSASTGSDPQALAEMERAIVKFLADLE